MISEANERDVQLLERTLVIFENVAKGSKDKKGTEDPFTLKMLAELQSEELERAARIIYICQWDIDHAKDRDQNLKTKDIVDRIYVIVQKLHAIFKELSKNNEIKFPKLSQPTDCRYGSDRGEKGENLAQSVATGLRWYADRCKRKAEGQQLGYSNSSNPGGSSGYSNLSMSGGYSNPSTSEYSNPSTSGYSNPSTSVYSNPSSSGGYSMPSTSGYSNPSTSGYSNPSQPGCSTLRTEDGAPRAKVAKQKSEDWDLPKKIPVLKVPEISPEQVQKMFEKSNWASHVDDLLTKFGEFRK